MLPFTLFALLSLPTLPARDPRADLEAFVTRVASQAVEREGVPGVSIAVYADGELLFARGFGWADERLGLPMQKSTLFPIGTLGRSLVAATVLREVEGGSLALDATLEKLLPGTPAALQGIPLRRLLDGTSGLPASTVLFEALRARKLDTQLDRAEFLGLLASLPRQGPLGDQFAGDSSAWLLLPLILCQKPGQSFGARLQEDLCAPLGLADTRRCDEAAGVLGHAADCREVLEGRALEIWSGVEPAEARANLCSTPADLVRWQSMLFGRALLGEASTRILTESALSTTGTPLGQNACFERGTLGGETRWRHVGGIGGWRGALGWYDPRKLGVCVLANCAGARVADMEEDIARFVLRLAPREVQDLALEPAEIQAFCGTYQLGTTHVRILEREGRLWYESALQETLRLRSQGFGRFLSLNGEVLLTFISGDGRATGFEETHRGTTSVAKRME